MKTKVMIGVAILTGITLFTSCKDQHSGTIPEETVLKAFNEKYPGINKVEWETKSGYKVAEFKNGSYEMEAWFDINGNWMMTETDIPFNQLPEIIQSNFENSEYSDWKVEDVDKLERVNIETLYIIEIEKGENEADLHYTEEGLLVETIVDKDDPDGGYQPAVIPEAVQNFLTQKYPGYILLDFDIESTGFEIDIKDKGIHKEVLFDKASEWVHTKWEIHRNQLPGLITDALKNSEYGQYDIDDIEMMEKPDGIFYLIELEQGDKEITITFDETGTIL